MKNITHKTIDKSFCLTLNRAFLAVAAFAFLIFFPALQGKSLAIAAISPANPEMADDLPLAPMALKGGSLFSQPRIAVGGIDAGFGANITEGSSQIYSVATQPDGKVIAGGNFTSVEGVKRGSIERFNADGTRDLSFNPGGVGANGAVYVIIVLPTGKIMISGNFVAYNNLNAPRIARLNADGTLDTTFTAQGTSTNAGIQDTIIQPDGKFLISGNFTSFNGTIRNRVARLNADGTLDTAFNPNINGFVEELVLQPDGKIVIGGVFSLVGTTARNGVARLNSDGNIDTSFVTGPGIGTGTSTAGAVYALDIQADGKILIGGVFNNFNGFPRQNIVRLTTDGSLDGAFNPNTDGSGIEFFAVQPDGKIVIVGQFNSSNAGIVRLETNGSFDSTFNGGSVDDFGYVVALQSDGKILLGGLFTQYGGNVRQNIARLGANGSSDSFAPSIAGDPVIRVIAQQTDGKLLVGGQFRKANGALRRNVARFNLDGTLDTTFDPANNFGGFSTPSVFSIAQQADGRVLVGGNFSVAQGNSRNFVTRLNANGAVDNSFFYNDAVLPVVDIEIQPDGKIVLAGFFQNDGLQVFSGIVRLLGNGSYDPANIGTGANNSVREIKQLAGGKGLIMGSFTSYNGTPRNRIARINPDGSLDTTFDPGTGANSTVYDAAFLPNGQIYLGGFFSNYNGAANTNDIVRINANGAVDTSFSSGATGFAGGIYSLSLEPDGKILAGGNFSAYNGTGIFRLALLNTSGTLDSTFTSPLNSDSVNFVFRLFRQSDGKIVVGGGFTSPRNALFRFDNVPIFVQRRAPFDFDGDNKTDLSIFRPGPGEWWVNRSTNGGTFALQFGSGTDRIAPADFTGDGKTDVAFWRPSTGQWFVLRSEDSSFFAFPFGANGDVPAPADYDGDGKADAAVFRPSSNTWFILRSGGGTTITGFGIAGDVPVAADYDGDGKADIAIYRPNAVGGAQWWIQRSSNLAVFATQFGASTDRTVQGDYTGDGKADIAFWRPSTGFWNILRSEDFSFFAFPFGASGDVPSPGDYDGDGKFDAAVFRPSNSTWFANRSSSTVLIQQFGITGDLPVPNAFVP